MIRKLLLSLLLQLHFLPILLRRLVDKVLEPRHGSKRTR